MKTGSPHSRAPAPAQAHPAAPPPGSPRRLRVLLLLGLSLLLLAAWVWREPAELAWLRRGPVSGLERYVDRHPGSTPGLRTLGVAYLREGRAADAARVLVPALERFPEDAPLRVLAARALLESGSPPQAYGHLQVATQALKSDDPEALWLLGQALEQLGRPDEAYDQYDALIRKQPRHVDALLRLGALAVVDGRLSVAEEFFRRAAVADPRSADAAAQLAQVLFRQGDAMAAAAEARRAVRLQPEHVRGNFWLGRSLLVAEHGGSGGEAETALRKAIAGVAGPSEARYYLAKLLRAQGRAREAAAELEASVRENPLDKESFYDLALLSRTLGQPERAREAMGAFRRLQAQDEEGTRLEQKVFADANDHAARLELARYYLKYRRPDLAREQVAYVLKQSPDDTDARRLSAEVSRQLEPGS